MVTCVILMKLIPFILILTLLPNKDSQGVIISSGDGSGNTSAPADDPGFANLGTRGVGGAIYLGNRYVLTANHVGAGSVNFGGTTYSAESGTTTRIANPSGIGLSTYTDLIIFRLTSDPGLPSLQIASSTPAVGTEVTMVGAGRNRALSETFWNIDPTANPDAWTELPSADGAETSGYKPTGTRSIRWGENEIWATTTIGLGSHGHVLSLVTRFDEAGRTHEAQAVNGDSGGALFVKEDGVWKLGGVINAVGEALVYNGRPPGETSTNPYAYYGRYTTSADLSRYRDQLMPFMPAVIPEPSQPFLLGLGSLTLLARKRPTY